MSDEAVPELCKINPETRPIWKKRRYHVVFLVFWGSVALVVLRQNFSVAIVSMVDDFHWNSKTQGLVLSSFFMAMFPHRYLED